MPFSKTDPRPDSLVRQSLGAMAPEVDRRLAGFLAQAGLGE